MIQSGELGAGSAVLVLGPRRSRREFCLGHLATAERTAAVVLPPDPAGVIEESFEPTATGILCWPLDHEVTLTPESGPETRAIAEPSTGA